jgi:putative CocE/NonD family hydrolase
MRHLIAAAAFLSLLVAHPLGAQSPTGYDRRELSIPMRDGTRLFAVALIPQSAPEPLPIILIRTPFGAAREFRNTGVPAPLKELAQDGYIFVTQDIRGRNGAGGTFVINRAQDDASNARGTNESTDAYDTIEWLIKNLPNNSGKVGVLGISYRGWLAGLAGVGAHPALKAISPQAPTTDTWMGDDFFHQGAFRLTQGLIFAAFIELARGRSYLLNIPDVDQYGAYLRFPTLDSLAKAMELNQSPYWTPYIAHPAYDAYWKSKAMQNVLTRPEVPVLFVGGWWDQEDILGPQLAYHTVEKADRNDWNRIVLGPWYHGGWSEPGGDSLGPIRLGSKTADYFRENIQRPWFAYYLHGKGDGHFPEAWAFATGENRWHTFDSWPPKSATPRNLYLGEHGTISFDPPRSARAPAVAGAPRFNGHTAEYDSYVADPARPVPYLARPDDANIWQTWLQQDQRFADSRPDVLSWQSEPLAEGITIVGNVVAHLFASTTGTDADWVVKLIDVYPDSVPDRPAMAGYQLMVNADVMRGRYWKDFSVATPIPANTVTPFTVDLHEQLYRFEKGHRIMVQIQSSWFPLYDRNPQTFVPNIFTARASDYRAQEHRIWHTARYPSHLSLMVLP